MQHIHKQNTVTPFLMSMLSTTISWLVNEDELNKAVENHLQEIRELNTMSDGELRSLGIRRDQITAYVLSESNEA
jgi:uncharacterized protein YjiS (DUF1127 family)